MQYPGIGSYKLSSDSIARVIRSVLYINQDSAKSLSNGRCVEHHWRLHHESAIVNQHLNKCRLTTKLHLHRNSLRGLLGRGSIRRWGTTRIIRDKREKAPILVNVGLEGDYICTLIHSLLLVITIKRDA
jgi:hypothetical protein